MKKSIFKLLRLLKLDVLLLGLFEKLALSLIKKLLSFHSTVTELLNQCLTCNGENR